MSLWNGGFTLEAISEITGTSAAIIYDNHTNIPYYLPSSVRVKNEHKALNVISLFTGGGGLDLGLEWAGFQTKCFIENNPYCIQTINKNRPAWPLVKNGDITRISGEDILVTTDLKRGEPHLVAGGAPCQPFSSLGKNEGESNLSGQLYKHFIRIVKEVQPAMFLFENVRGMMQNHTKIIAFMNNEFGRLGYGLSIALLCAADYGVPQKRYRVFIIGRRDGKKPGFPMPTHAENPDKSLAHFQALFQDQGYEFPYRQLCRWQTVGDAFKQLTPVHYAREDSISANLAPHIVHMIKQILPGTKMCWQDLPDELKFDCWKKGKFFGKDNFARLLYSEPAVTIRTGAVYPAKGKYIHPEEDRGLNTMELAALQSFPIDLRKSYGWFFCGGITPISRQIGNAVPPVLAKALGIAIRQQIEEILEC